MKVKNYVYMLRHDGEVVYVGATDNKTTLLRRMINHVGVKEFNSVDLIECPEGDGFSVESKLILKYQPKYNHVTSCSDEYISLSVCLPEISILIKAEFDVARLKNRTYLKRSDIGDIKTAIKGVAVHTSLNE